jgi:SPP1 family predicted phage head-tail adaptor
MIKAGVMKERVLIQAPSESRNSLGETTIGWEDAGEVWASVDGLSSREILQAMQANVIASHKIRIRFFPEITPHHRVVWRGKNLEVASVVERNNRTVHEMLVREVQ